MLFQERIDAVGVDTSKRVAEIDVRLIVSDSAGQVNITDIMLQGGEIGTVWTGHPSEIKWSFDG